MLGNWEGGEFYSVFPIKNLTYVGKYEKVAHSTEMNFSKRRLDNITQERLYYEGRGT